MEVSDTLYLPEASVLVSSRPGKLSRMQAKDGALNYRAALYIMLGSCWAMRTKQATNLKLCSGWECRSQSNLIYCNC